MLSHLMAGLVGFISALFYSALLIQPWKCRGTPLPILTTTLEIKREVETKRYLTEYPQVPIRRKRFVGASTTEEGSAKIDRFQEWLKRGDEMLQRSTEHEVDVAQSRVLGQLADTQEVAHSLLVLTADAVISFLNETRRYEFSRALSTARDDLLRQRSRHEYRDSFEFLATKQGAATRGWGAIHTTLQVIVYMVIFALPCIIVIYCLRLALLRRRQRGNNNNTYFPVPVPPQRTDSNISHHPNGLRTPQLPTPSTYSL